MEKCPFCFQTYLPSPVHMCTGISKEIPICKFCKSLSLCDSNCKFHCKCPHNCCPPFICNCGKVFHDPTTAPPYITPAATRFSIHYQLHQGDPEFKYNRHTCPYCGIHFDERQKYVAHMSAVHVKRREQLMDLH